MNISKITLSMLAYASLAISCTAFANLAPAMRGEYHAVNLPNAVNLNTQPIHNLPTPKTNISKVVVMPTVLIDATRSGNVKIDATLIDEFIDDVSPNARHYPPNFPNRTALYNTRENIRHLSAWLEPYATAPNASFDVLLRAAKINGMGRNLDMGSEYGVRASTHIAQALKLNPNHTEANFLYGMMIAEGGGFNESKKYLDKAAAAGYLEAEQSLAQAALLNDNKAQALSILQRLQTTHPNNPQIREQINIIQNGGYYIWNIKNDDINVKPIER